MDDLTYYDFRIDAWRPDTLPLKRLSEYMAELAKLFGSTEHVHLMKVRLGSATPELAVHKTAQQKVEARLSLVGATGAPADIPHPFRKLNTFLLEDNACATLRRKKGAILLDFPGKKTPLAEEITIHEAGSLEGIVFKVGGSDDTIPVWLEDENKQRLHCTTSRSMAKELAAHLFGEAIRVTGNGKWRRGSDRIWSLESFTIKSWEALEKDNLELVIRDLREVPGSGWNEMEDAQSAWRSLRNET
jgi:hypothetical protein